MSNDEIFIKVEGKFVPIQDAAHWITCLADADEHGYQWWQGCVYRKKPSVEQLTLVERITKLEAALEELLNARS